MSTDLRNFWQTRNLRGYKIIEPSFKSSFELLDILLDEMTRGVKVKVRDRVRVRVRVNYNFGHVYGYIST